MKMPVLRVTGLHTEGCSVTVAGVRASAVKTCPLAPMTFLDNGVCYVRAVDMNGDPLSVAGDNFVKVFDCEVWKVVTLNASQVCLHLPRVLLHGLLFPSLFHLCRKQTQSTMTLAFFGGFGAQSPLG